MADHDTTPILIEKKSHRCPSCGKNFSRQDHLRRHSLSHTGGKPYSCLFCRQDFARSDRLRDHYADCPARGDREIPQKTQRGRRRRACAACTASKLRCDGGTPCSCCQRRNLTCDTSRVHQPEQMDMTRDDSIPGHHSPSVSESSDASSIKALIDGGTRGFIEGFNLPRVSDMEAGTDSAPMASEMAGGDLQALRDFEHHVRMELQLPDMLDFPAHVADLWVGPPGHELPYFAENGEGHPGWSGSFSAPEFFQGSDIEPLDVMQAYKPDSFQLALMKDMMLQKARGMHPDPARLDEVSAIIQSMFCQAKVDRFVRMFFQNFHPNCPIFHMPTFDADAITTELLLAVFCFGAMYAHDGTDKLVADHLLDIAELLIFSTEIFAERYGGGRESREEDPEESDEGREWKRFEQLQAGYLIVTLQYWAGTRSAKAHVMESRFCEVIKAARKTGLTQVHRVPQDRISEQSWIRKEIKLRTMCMIRSLDCAFLFYSNYPCRLTLSELNIDLPCDSSIFNSKHPFAEEDFQFSRSGNLASVFDELFSERTTSDFTDMQAGDSFHDPKNKAVLRTMKTQTFVDLFLSIHLLYVFAHTHTQLRRYVPRTGQQQGAKLKCGQLNPMHGNDEITEAVQNALKRWHVLFLAVRSRTDDTTLSHSGLSKLSYNFWLVIHLFVDKGKSLDLARSIDVQGEDKLILLKRLL